jgi:hypothetical protein
VGPAIPVRSGIRPDPLALATARAGSGGGGIGLGRLGAGRRHQSGALDLRLLAGAGAHVGSHRVLSRWRGLASHCEVAVALESGELVVRVADNGVGLGRPYVSGMGVTSMRSRVQALGGTFDLGAAPDGGTRLLARIPVEQ